MPEIRECLAFYHMARNWFERAQEDELSLCIVQLHADAADSNHSETKLTKGGLPYVLQNTSNVKRGSKSSQYPLFPPPLRKTKGQPSPPAIDTYHLFDVDRTMRSLILGFRQDDEDGGRVLYAKIAYLTHTALQIYTAAQWEVVRNTPRPSKKTQDDEQLGRARVGLAIELATHTIAFITHDNIFEVVWKEKKTELPKLYVGVYDDWCAFLEGVVAWLKSRVRLQGRNSRLARAVIRECQETFNGVGVYTVNELFFDAGLPPFISEAELADCPSRMARLCDALWSYAHVSVVNLGKLLAPATAQGVLAPTKKHRKRYVHWLHVHARDYCRMPRRMAELLEEFEDVLEKHAGEEMWCRSQEEGLYDVFDPWYIRHALMPPDELVNDKSDMGHLIFGPDEYREMVGDYPEPNDPLTRYFRDTGKLVAAQTHLKPGHYLHGGIIGEAHRKRVQRPTLFYQTDKQVWTGTPHYGRNCVIAPDEPGPPLSDLELRTGAERESKLFLTIVEKKKQVAVGPLEYSANASQATSTHGVKMVHPLRGANYQQTLAFHRSVSASTSSLIAFGEQDSEEEDEDQQFDITTEPASPSASEYNDHPNFDADYASDYPPTSCYDSSSDTDTMSVGADSDGPIFSQPPFPSLPSSSSATGSLFHSPPHKKMKRRHQPRKYTKTNESTLLEAAALLEDFGSDGVVGSVLESTDEPKPELKRKRSSRNSVAHYCFSARGNAMDPGRRKGKGGKVSEDL